MKQYSMVLSLRLVPLLLLLFSPVLLAFEEWRISEIFSSSDGQLQYVVLTSSVANQNNLAGRTLVARNATGGDERSYTFPTNLAGSTQNRSVLIATQNFSSATGLALDYVIPAGFVHTEGGSVNFSGVDALFYQAVELPRNGSQALKADNSVAIAMPTNFQGQSVNPQVAVTLRFDDTTGLLHLPVVDVAGLGIVNASLQLTSDDPIQFSLVSAYEYNSGISSGEGAAQVDANGALYLPAVGVGNEIYEVRMDLLDPNTYVFGNLAVLSVTTPTPPPGPPPVQPSPLEASINAGQQVFAQLCAVCHGPSGSGTNEAPSLVSSSLTTLDQLRTFIGPNMPFGSPAQCVDNAGSSCATDVSNYILHRIQFPGSDLDIGEGAY